MLGSLRNLKVTIINELVPTTLYCSVMGHSGYWKPGTRKQRQKCIPYFKNHAASLMAMYMQVHVYMCLYAHVLCCFFFFPPNAHTASLLLQVYDTSYNSWLDNHISDRYSKQILLDLSYNLINFSYNKMENGNHWSTLANMPAWHWLLSRQ